MSCLASSYVTHGVWFDCLFFIFFFFFGGGGVVGDFSLIIHYIFLSLYFFGVVFQLCLLFFPFLFSFLTSIYIRTKEYTIRQISKCNFILSLKKTVHKKQRMFKYYNYSTNQTSVKHLKQLVLINQVISFTI